MVKKIRPVSRIVKIEAEINKIVGEVFFQKKELLGLDESWIPCADVSEKASEVTIKIELPGVAHKDITLLLHSNRIEIKGVKRENLPKGKIRFIRVEREYGPFRRFIFLPEVVVPEKSRASLENGVLTISLKKSKKEREILVKIEGSKP